MQKTEAIVIRSLGGPEVLKLETVDLPPPGAASLSAPPAGTNTAANYANDIKADPSMQEACQTGAIGGCP